MIWSAVICMRSKNVLDFFATTGYIKYITPNSGGNMKLGDLVKLKDDYTGLWNMGILVEYYEQFQGWMVHWSGTTSRSFHSSRHLEMINESR